MSDYVSLLRGVNVGGKTLKMDDLLEVYESLGLRDVKSYIQSGNVLFDTADADTRLIKAELENRILIRFGLEVTVIIRDRRGRHGRVQDRRNGNIPVLPGGLRENRILQRLLREETGGPGDDEELENRERAAPDRRRKRRRVATRG